MGFIKTSEFQRNQIELTLIVHIRCYIACFYDLNKCFQHGFPYASDELLRDTSSLDMLSQQTLEKFKFCLKFCRFLCTSSFLCLTNMSTSNTKLKCYEQNNYFIVAKFAPIEIICICITQGSPTVIGIILMG